MTQRTAEGRKKNKKNIVEIKHQTILCLNRGLYEFHKKNYKKSSSLMEVISVLDHQDHVEPLEHPEEMFRMFRITTSFRKL